MSTQEERPSLESRKRRIPRPAPDESVDPIDYRPAGAAPSTLRPVTPAADSSPVEEVVGTSAARTTEPTSAPVTTPRGRPRREVTLPFSTRLSVDVLNLIDEAVANGEGGGIIRNVVEEAIRARWDKK